MRVAKIVETFGITRLTNVLEFLVATALQEKKIVYLQFLMTGHIEQKILNLSRKNPLQYKMH